MSAGVQALIVALAVVSCAAYSIWRLLSARLRLRLLDGCGALPGIGNGPPPTSPEGEMVWWGARNGRL